MSQNMTDAGDVELLQIIGGKVGKNFRRDFVGGERRDAALETELAKPGCEPPSRELPSAHKSAVRAELPTK